CPANQVCGTRAFNVDGTTAVINACVSTSQPQLACNDDVDCAARNETCSALDNIGGTLTPVCAPRPSGTGEVGDSCSGSNGSLEFPTECASGFCEGLDGICIDQCSTDAECGSGLVCTTADAGNVSGRWCAESCDNMADCGHDRDVGSSRICRRRCDDEAPAGQRGFDRVCGTPVGTLNTNVTLTGAQTAGDCKSGFSIRSGATNESYCSEPCAATPDCPTGMQCTFSSTSTCGGAVDGRLYCRRP
ncbi:MAG TPA: hypothetical protein VGF99_02115, partial [Myxococcota bacterium]